MRYATYRSIDPLSGLRQLLTRLFAAVALAAAAGAAAAQSPTWPEAHYNRKPIEGDLVLPMPCGGAMAFRRVNVPSGNLLDDYEVKLGSLKGEPHSENPRTDHVAGMFVDEGQGRYYYIGKYEVTAPQYDALGPSCPDLTAMTPLPKVKVTWAEAVTFAEQYTEWLFQNDPEALPTKGGAPGFFRLPTEPEWEFAARGGLSASGTALEADRFPMGDEPIARYVWYGGSESADGYVNEVGLLLPNPLGLFDILGNVAELALESYRMNHHNRLHGQAGGFVKRGGDFNTDKADVRSGARKEFVPLARRGLRREDSTGFRIVLVAQTVADRKELKAVIELWPTLASSDGTPALAAERADPVLEAHALAKSTTDDEMKRRLENLAGVIEINIKTRNEERDKAGREIMRNAVYVLRLLNIAEARLSRLKSTSTTARTKKNLQAGLRNHRFNFDFYMGRVLNLSKGYSEGVLANQGNVLKSELEGLGYKENAASVGNVLRDTELVRAQGITAASDTVIERYKTLGGN